MRVEPIGMRLKHLKKRSQAVIYESGSWTSADSKSTSTLILNFSVPELRKISVLFKPPKISIFVIAAQT